MPDYSKDLMLITTRYLDENLISYALEGTKMPEDKEEIKKERTQYYAHETLERLAYAYAQWQHKRESKQFMGPTHERVELERLITNALEEQFLQVPSEVIAGVEEWEKERELGFPHSCYASGGILIFDDPGVGPKPKRYDDLLKFLEFLKVPLEPEKAHLVKKLQEGRVIEVHDVTESKLARFKVPFPTYDEQFDSAVTTGVISVDVANFMANWAKDILARTSYQDLTDTLNIYLQKRGWSKPEIQRAIYSFLKKAKGK